MFNSLGKTVAQVMIFLVMISLAHAISPTREFDFIFGVGAMGLIRILDVIGES